MTNEEKDKIKNKWAPILNSMGVTGSKADWMSEYANLHIDNENNRDKKIDSILKNNLATEDTFPSLLPIAMRVAARTIGQDIGGFASKEEIDSVKNRITQENRDGKIESIINDKPFLEKKLEEDEEYKDLMKRGVTPMSGPSSQLFYLDYQYGTGTASI
jgi:hypothetical protein